MDGEDVVALRQQALAHFRLRHGLLGLADHPPSRRREFAEVFGHENQKLGARRQKLEGTSRLCVPLF